MFAAACSNNPRTRNTRLRPFSGHVGQQVRWSWKRPEQRRFTGL